MKFEDNKEVQIEVAWYYWRKTDKVELEYLS